MKRIADVGITLVFASLMSGPLWAQQAAHVEKAKAVPSKPAVKVMPASQKLFGTLGIATKSVAARQDLELALSQYENAGFDDAILHTQSATKKDPNFALAYAVWSFAARRTQAAPEALAKAKALKTKCAADECLLVQFLTGTQEANVLLAIAAMNDLLTRHPKDKHVLYLAGEWLFFQQDFEGAEKLWTSSLALDPKFPPALNMLGYSYVEGLEPDPQKAIGYLRRYAQALPDQPNPQDSLGEVLRIAGDDGGSLAHYAEALRISPRYITSQYGRGDTYTLMGNYAQARAEYDKALKIATNSHDTLHIQFQKALVHFWEGDVSGGQSELATLSGKAAEQKDASARYEIDYARALLSTDAAGELKILQTLEGVLTESAAGMTEAERNAALANVLREEVRLAVITHRTKDAEAVVQKLEHRAAESRDLLVESSYESSRGYLLAVNGDLASAADQLAGDLHAPLAVQQLILIQEKLGNTQAAEKAQNRLKYLRTPTAEWYLVTKKNGVSAQLISQ